MVRCPDALQAVPTGLLRPVNAGAGAAARLNNCGFGVFLQQPGGTHGAEACYMGAAPRPQADVLAVGDISGDGRADIVTSKSVLLQRSVGAFAEQVRRPDMGQASILGRVPGSASH
jgi:hypothetical protein